MAWDDHVKGLAGSQSGPAPEPEDTTPSWLAPFRLKTYTDYGKRQFEAGDNADLMTGVPQLSFLAKSFTSPIKTAKETASSIWDFLGKPLVEGAVRSYEQGRQLPRVDDEGYYVGTPKAEPLDAFNAASIAPLGAFGASAAGVNMVARDADNIGLNVMDGIRARAAAKQPGAVAAEIPPWHTPSSVGRVDSADLAPANDPLRLESRFNKNLDPSDPYGSQVIAQNAREAEKLWLRPEGWERLSSAGFEFSPEAQLALARRHKDLNARYAAKGEENQWYSDPVASDPVQAFTSHYGAAPWWFDPKTGKELSHIDLAPVARGEGPFGEAWRNYERSMPTRDNWNMSPVNYANDGKAALPGVIVNAADSGAFASPLEVRPMDTQALHKIGEANFTVPYRVDPVERVPLSSLSGGYFAPEKVGPLAERIKESGWLEPLVVNRAGDVIEGQHRLRALGELGQTDVPVHRLRELASEEGSAAIRDAARGAGVRREQAAQIADQVARIVDEEGSVTALDLYDPPRGFEKAWSAAVEAAKARGTLFSNDKSASIPGVLVNAAKEIDARGFYSPSLEAAKGLTQQSGTVQQFKAQILKNGGKPKELEAVGFDKAFPDPNAKVSRAEIEDFLRSNRVELGEVKYGGKAHDTTLLRTGDQSWSLRGRDGEPTGVSIFEDAGRFRVSDTRGSYATLGEALDSARNHAAVGSRFESYSTPGGIPGSYREVVTTLPPDRARIKAEVRQQFQDGTDEAVIDGLVDDIMRNPSKHSGPFAANTYTSSHWPGVTNPLLHYRTKDFPSAPGANSTTRLLDELQSDWGQRARDKGFRDPAVAAQIKTELDAKISEMAELDKQIQRIETDKILEELDLGGGEVNPFAIQRAINDPSHPLSRTLAQKQEEILALKERRKQLRNEQMDLANKWDAASREGVPSAPYISNTSDWVDLGLKQSLIDAARDPSVSRFAWTPGDVQAQRYGMEHHLDRIEVLPPSTYDTVDGGRGVRVVDSRGGTMADLDIGADGTVIGGHGNMVRDAKGKPLGEVIGQELADRVMTASFGSRLSGLDLRVGGEGHKKFYGTMSPEGYQSGIVGTRLQKLVKGLDPEAARIEPETLYAEEWMRDMGRPPFSKHEAPMTYPSIPFTETLRKKILEEGLPLFVNDKNAALPGVLLNAAEQSLPMDQASRLARAREMGFDVDNPAYRGLTRPYDESDAAKQYYQMFTSDREQAGEYAMKGLGMGRPNVVPAFLRKGKNLAVDGFERNFNVIPTRDLPEPVRRRLGSVAAMDEIAHAAREAGYDSVTVRNIIDNAMGERTGAPVSVDTIFDPKNVRSVNAFFDPAKASSKDLLAANPAGAGIPAEIMSLYERLPERAFAPNREED